MNEATEIALKETHDLALETMVEYTKIRASFPDMKSHQSQEALERLYGDFITQLIIINHKFKEGRRVEKATGGTRV